MATSLTLPSDLSSRTAQQKADFYGQQRAAGFSDPAIRSAVTGAVGPQSDADWGMLLNLSGYGMPSGSFNTNLSIPSDIESRTAQQKADYYGQQRAAGFSDSAIRNAVSGVVGPQSDEDWNALLGLAGYGGDSGGFGGSQAPSPAPANVSPFASGNNLIAALRNSTPGLPAGSASSFSMLPNRPPAPTFAPSPEPSSQQPFLLNRVTPSQAMPAAAPGSARPVGTPVGGGKTPASAPTTAPASVAQPATSSSTPARTPPPPPENARFPSWVYTELDPLEKAAVYNSYAQRGTTSDEIRALAGTQTDEEWAALVNLADTMPIDIVKAFPTQTDVETAVSNWRATQNAQPESAQPESAEQPKVEDSEGLQFAMQPGGIGFAKYYENIADFLRKEPTEEELRSAMQEYRISDLDVRRARIIHGLPGKR